MKRSLKLTILVAVLVLLIGGWKLTEKLTEKTQVSEESGTFALTTKTVDDLSELIWTSGDDSCHFTYADGAWTNADDADFPTDSDAVQKLADKLTGTQATRKLENVENEADYGFGDESYAVTAVWSDGTQTVYTMGDATPFADGYYIRLSDDENIYTITSSLSAMFAEQLADLAVLEEIPTAENVTRMTVGEGFDISKREESATLDASRLWYDSEGNALDTASAESLISSASAISWSDLENTNADDLSVYGLDEPTILTLYSGSDTALELLIGSANDDGDYYAKLPDSKLVYTISATNAETVLNADAATLAATELVPLDKANLTGATFAVGETLYLFEYAPEIEAVEATDDTEAVEAVAASVTMNGTEYDVTTFESLWTQVTSLSISGSCELDTSETPILSLTASNASGCTQNFDFYSYDADSYAVRLDDGRTVLTQADTVDYIIRFLKQL